jgi:hypothetical protein
MVYHDTNNNVELILFRNMNTLLHRTTTVPIFAKEKSLVDDKLALGMMAICLGCIILPKISKGHHHNKD